MGTNGGNNKVLSGGLYDRPTGRHGIGCRACRCADDDSVTAKGHHFDPIAFYTQLDGTGYSALGDHGIVECIILQNDLPFMHSFHMEHHALIDGVGILGKAGKLRKLRAL